MFWNVENLFDTADHPDKADDEFTPESFLRWTPRAYRYKLEQLGRIIRRENAVILGLAEVENREVLEDLVKYLPRSNAWDIIHREGADRRGIDTALLYRKDILDSINAVFYQPSLPSGNETREFLMCELSFRKGGEPLILAVVHFPSRRGGRARTHTDRLACSRQLMRVLNRKYSGKKTLIMGDLNAGPDEEQVRILTRVYENLIPTGDNWTYAYRGECEQLDYLLVSSECFSGNPVIIPGSGTVIRPPQMQDAFGFPEAFIQNRRIIGGVSDHFPIKCGVLEGKGWF